MSLPQWWAGTSSSVEGLFIIQPIVPKYSHHTLHSLSVRVDELLSVVSSNLTYVLSLQLHWRQLHAIIYCVITTQIAKFMGPTWVLLAPDGPFVGTMNLAIREYLITQFQCVPLYSYGHYICISYSTVWYKTKFGSQNFGYQLGCLFCNISNVLKNMFSVGLITVW